MKTNFPPTTAYILKKKQKVLWTNITDILDFLRNQKGGEAGERITLIEILYQLKTILG